MNVLENFWASTPLQVVALLIGSAALLAIGVAILVRVRKNPKDKEQRRRLTVNLNGRLGDATITEVQGDIIYYEYSVGGVLYTASQDISQLREHIPTDPERLIGLVSLKYSTNNPANSIILCENWSGLRIGSPSRTFEREEA